jgi:L-aspartate oxidase
VLNVPRHLRPFEARALPQLLADVVVLGSGVAGTCAALAAAEDGANVLLLTKAARLESNTRWAQGGMAAAVGPDDSVALHAEDTLGAGDGLCRGDVVRSVVGEAPEAVRELERRGVRFDRDAEGAFSLGREGGHQRHRIVHASGDATGFAIETALVRCVGAERRIRVVENAFAIDLLTDEGVCVGVVVLIGGEVRIAWAPSVVLATGGAARLFRESTNPAVTTGDGIAMAYRAGARVRDMEFMQFHPTVLYVPGAARKLITEAARGWGAHILDQRGVRFLPDYDARGELAPRDVVSRAIVEHLTRHGDDHALLDLRPIPAATLHERLPGIVATGRSVGIDVTREPLPIRPAAHYTIGGVVCDGAGRTTVPGLLAAGEVTTSGLHGANRLASNSLLEGVVHGLRAGRGAAERARVLGPARALDLSGRGAVPEAAEIDYDDLVRSVTSLVWRRAGVRRRGSELEDGRADLLRWSRLALGATTTDPAGLEAQNLCILADLLLEAAWLRRETRGVHCRLDFPARDDAAFLVHVEQSIDGPPRLVPWSDAAPEVSW